MMGNRRTGSPPPAESAVNWLDLPDELLLSVLDRLPSHLDLFAASAVCRSWRAVACCLLSSASVDRPPLLLSPAVMPRHHRYGENRPSHSAIISPIGPRARSRAMISLRNFGLSFLGSAYGQLIFDDQRDIIIADIFTGVELRVPLSPKQLRGFSSTTLTRPLTHPGSSLLVCSDDSIFRWRLDDGGAWEVFKRGPNAFPIIQMVPFKGEIFGLGIRGRLCAIDVSSSPLSLKELVQGLPEMFVPFTYDQYLVDCGSGVLYDMFVPFTYGQYLVECGGELMLLQIFSGPKKTIKNALYRLSLSGQPEWVRADSLGDWALFVDPVSRTASSCANPGRWGGRSNFIYFAGPQHGRWNEFQLMGR